MSKFKNYMNSISLNEWLAVFVAIFVTSSVVANIFEMKTIGWNNFALVGGGILFSGSFFGIMHIITEVWGNKIAKRVTIFATIVTFVIAFMAQVLIWLPGIYLENNIHFAFIMGQGFRIILASETAFLTSQLINIKIFGSLREKTEDKNSIIKFTFSSGIGTFIGQLIDNFLFVLIAFAPLGISSFEMPWKDIASSAILGTCFEMIIQVIVAIFFAKIAMSLKRKISKN